MVFKHCLYDKPYHTVRNCVGKSKFTQIKKPAFLKRELGYLKGENTLHSIPNKNKGSKTQLQLEIIDL